MTPASRRDDGPPGDTDRTETLTGDRRIDASSPSSIDGGRFAPGAMLGERYRLVALLGVGGMGEVYRAEDLRLGQTVALKFLPPGLAGDGAAQARLQAEVRTARLITHQNVVRVHDLGEIAGQSFLSMEFVEGEDLASLLKRIGRLPQDKALELARQICAGLAAAHGRGFLHRDLKPANVMVDQEGHAKISDFGLAGLSTDLEGAEPAGTPAYMAPEQLAEGKASFASDLFSLGLILYEMFSGQRAFEAKSRTDLIKRHEAGLSDSLADHVSGIDPAVERVVEACLARDPGQRPQSALEVAAALPGGDPLAAALAAGETPSPEMVARARVAGALRPWVGALIFATLTLTVAGAALFRDRAAWPNLVELRRPPAVLEDRARTLVADLGYDLDSTISYQGFRKDLDYFAWVREQVPIDRRAERAVENQPALVGFWLAATQRANRDVYPRWSDFDPLRDGELKVLLDPEGRLVEFAARPSSRNVRGDGTAAEPFDWQAVFSEAGLDLEAFTATDPRRLPAGFVTERKAWSGHFPRWPENEVRVEATALDGRLAEFALFTPWRDVGSSGDTARGSLAALWVMLSILLPTILVLAVYLLRRNLKSGRGDRRGASRLATFLFCCLTLGWVFGAPHVGSPLVQVGQLFLDTGSNLLIAALFWVVYIAFEPALRKRWPAGMVSWTRLLAGRFRDPLIGRDVLLGATTASLVCCAFWAIAAASGARLEDGDWLFAFEGLRGASIALLQSQTMVPLLNAFQRIFLFTLFLLLFRHRPWAIVAITVMAFAEYSVVVGMDSGTKLLIAPLMVAGIVYPVAFLGVTATAAYWFVFFLLNPFPALSMHFSGWQAALNLLVWALVLGLGLFGYRTATAGRPLFE